MSERTTADVIASLLPRDAKIIRECLISQGKENSRLKAWVNDLQSGMYVNCVYCGHRYGPREGTPVAMADVLKAHIEQCLEHPLSHAKAEVDRLQAGIIELDIRLLSGCKLRNQPDGKWWLFSESGEGLFGGTGSLIGIVEQLAEPGA